MNSHEKILLLLMAQQCKCKHLRLGSPQWYQRVRDKGSLTVRKVSICSFMVPSDHCKLCSGHSIASAAEIHVFSQICYLISRPTKFCLVLSSAVYHDLTWKWQSPGLLQEGISLKELRCEHIKWKYWVKKDLSWLKVILNNPWSSWESNDMPCVENLCLYKEWW